MELNNATQGVKLHRASAWKDFFVRQLAARPVAVSGQLVCYFWDETLPWAMFSPFEGHGSFQSNQGEVGENPPRHRGFTQKRSKTRPSGLSC